MARLPRESTAVQNCWTWVKWAFILPWEPREEALLVDISSGATLAAIAQKRPELPAGSRVLGFNYDAGERDLSIDGFLPGSNHQGAP